MTTSGQICRREAVYATRETTLQDTAKLMRHHHVGTIVVIDSTNGKRTPIGMVTDRDIVMVANAVDLDPNVITVGDIMALELVTVREYEGLLETAEIMRYKRVRQLPVVDREDQLVGIIAMDDLLEALAEQMTEMVQIMSEGRRRETQLRQ